MTLRNSSHYWQRLARLNKYPAGHLLIVSLVFGSTAIVTLGGLVSWGIIERRATVQRHEVELAFQIAEAGVSYYRWHLAHAATDYQDGTGGPGPYVHDYKDKDNVTIGQFSLTITPPPLGSTLVIIDSIGYLTSAPQRRRIVRARFAIPSLAKYALVINDNIRYGSTTETFGELHSNGGTRHDGIAHNLVSSAKTCYDDPDTVGGGSCERPGVWTSVSPASNVFLAGTSFPVPAVDFAGLAGNLASIKTQAQSGGRYFAPSGSLGYRLVLKTDDTFDLYRVNTRIANCGGNNSWTINTQTLLGNYAFPGNGVIFVEDDLWVGGAINTAHLTIGAAYFPANPATDKSIIVNNDVTYTNTDGQDTIGFIAQKDIIVGLQAEENLRVDGALIASSGKFYRPTYSGCGSHTYKDQLTAFGMIGSNTRPAVYYGSSGILSRDYIYDANLLYGPPPEFPLASTQYSLIDWQEVLP